MPDLIPFLDGEKWGYADTNGNVVIAPKWQYVQFFNGERAIVYSDDRRCVINKAGKYIIPPYRNWNGTFYNSPVGAYYNAKGKSGKWCVIDSNNKEILASVYDKTDAGNGFTRSGYFTKIEALGCMAAKMCKNGKFGIIDTLGRTLIPFEYDGIDIDGYPFSSNKYFVIRKGENMGLIDGKNRVIYPGIYYNIWIDKDNNNQIKLFRRKGSAIGDTNGKIVWEAKGYDVEFPHHDLYPVHDSSGKYGLMNKNHKLILPCTYLALWFTHDTIVVSQWITDSAKRTCQGIKYLDINNLSELSDWIDLYHPTKPTLPNQHATNLEVYNSHLPHIHKIKIGDSLMNEFKKDSILWGASGGVFQTKRMYSVRGITDGDSVARYGAVIDTNGNYVIAPRKTDASISIINDSNNLILISGETKLHKPYYRVETFDGKVMIPDQENSIECAYFHNNVFYAVSRDDDAYEVYTRSFEGNGRYTAHDFTYYLITEGGKPAPYIGKYKLHWHTDSLGLRTGHNQFYSNVYDGFNDPFMGYFMAEDTVGHSGIISIDGKIVYPEVSFKYNQFKVRCSELFIVDNAPIRNHRSYYGLDRLDRNNAPRQKNDLLKRGLPYMVNHKNQVLLDSLTVDDAGVAFDGTSQKIYTVTLAQAKSGISGGGMNFYFNNKGMRFSRNLPGDKK